MSFPAPTQTNIDAAKAEHGDIFIVSCKPEEGGAPAELTFLVKEADSTAMGFFLDARAKAKAEKKSEHRAGLSLFQTICVYPDREVLAAWCKKNPLTAIAVAGEAVSATIQSCETSSKKA